MGLGDYLLGDYEARIRKAVGEAIEQSLTSKVPTLVDDSLNRVQERSQKMLDVAQDRLRGATDIFFTDLEKRWEKRLETETRAQFKLLNRVLVYTLVVAVVSFLYALARTKLGW